MIPADQVCEHTEKFSRGYGFLALQLNRAAISISATIAEGGGRFTKADRRNFFGIARGSVQECVPLLELARRRRLLTSDEHTSLKESLEEIARMLSGLNNGLDKRDGWLAPEFVSHFKTFRPQNSGQPRPRHSPNWQAKNQKPKLTPRSRHEIADKVAAKQAQDRKDLQGMA